MDLSMRALTRPTGLLLAVALLTTPCIQAQQSAQLLDHERQIVAALQRLPEPELKAYYLRCSQAAIQRSLDASESALCSIGYELLLNDTFGGDFFALLAWSKSQPAEFAETALTGDR